MPTPIEPDRTHRMTRLEAAVYALAAALTVLVSHYFPMGFAAP
jgi:hypothetical protein